MKRREYLSKAAGSTALLIGTAGAAGATRGTAPVGAAGKSGDAITGTEFDATRLGGPVPRPRVSVECSASEVVVDGIVVVGSGCNTATLADATFDAGTLRLVVEEIRDPNANPLCGAIRAPAPIGVAYTARVTLTETPETVEVVHRRDAGETTRTRECSG